MYVLAKLRELNGNAPEERKLSDEVLGNLEKLLLAVADPKSQAQPTAEQISILWRTCHWPEGNARAEVISKKWPNVPFRDHGTPYGEKNIFSLGLQCQLNPFFRVVKCEMYAEIFTNGAVSGICQI